jgi:hypothetical protein
MKRLLVSLLLLFFISTALAREAELPGPDKWPTTVEATVSDFLSTLSAEDKRKLRETREEDLARFHLGWGTGIRNYYGLWRGNEALLESACGKDCHPDHASGVIIHAVWRELNEHLTPAERTAIDAKRALVTRKRAIYEKLESEYADQLAKVKDDFERCVGSRDTGAYDGRPFFEMFVEKSGQVREIVFFNRASPELKICLARLLHGFSFSSFTDHEFVTLRSVTYPPFCQVEERITLYR